MKKLLFQLMNLKKRLVKAFLIKQRRSQQRFPPFAEVFLYTKNGNRE